MEDILTLAGIRAARERIGPHIRRTPLLRARSLGAEVILFEGEQAARWAHVDELIAQRGYTMVHASEDPAVMAGQGTLALEVLEDAPDIDTFVVPLGGGGLLSGIAAAAKGIDPRIRVVGVEPAQAPKYFVSRGQGKPTRVPAGSRCRRRPKSASC
jgi:threonine dehydratase